MNLTHHGPALLTVRRPGPHRTFLGIRHLEIPVSARHEATRAGISFGSALAIAISWSVNHSILWAILHGVLSWLYVVYFAVTR